MSSAPPHSLASGGKPTSFGGIQGSNAPHLLDRSRMALRGSTPDSEALASSDDEPEQKNRLTQVTSNPGLKPIVRRTSWFNEDRQPSNRKPSLGANGPFSPISPGTATPSSDQLPWGSTAVVSSTSSGGRGHSSSASFPWSNNIWNNDSPKGPPQRLTEVLPSPTTMVPPGSAAFLNEDALTSPRDRENPVDPAIPFAIPLHPTIKPYRSQSYSVGQMETEAINVPPANYASHGIYGRSRTGNSYATLQHRPSRPSMLVSHDPQLLGQLQEVEDDEEGLNVSEPGSQGPLDTARTIEQLTKENARLRQAAATNSSAANVSQPARLRPRQSSRDTASEDSDQAVYECDDIDSQRPFRTEGSNGRRLSEYGVKSSAQITFAGIPENRTVESVKKGHWQSSLGFGGIGEPPQSRRHSFAEIPTRQNSTGSGGDTQAGYEIGGSDTRTNGRNGSPSSHGDALTRSPQGDSINYFSRWDHAIRSNDEYGAPPSTTLQQPFMQGQYAHPLAMDQSSHYPKHLLYIVTFKCQRADVFYVHESTGLQVNKGDLVIVEADRGTDLGTVATDAVPWSDAREAKERFIEDHHKWLMMFSQHSQNGTIAGPNPNGQPNASFNGNPSAQHGTHDHPSGDLKPKMIKRVAQNHEIQALREKEGAEAKAKRVCQQKVVEHRLRMEILDAEFQMDWKKLTFFYFADSYINFNPLVTDLFKIYKTRIWMSAINTAAIGSPGAHNILGGQSHRRYSPEPDEFSNRRSEMHSQDLPSDGSVPRLLGNNIWPPGREIGTLGGMHFPHLYSQQFQQNQAFDVRPMTQYPVNPYASLAPNLPSAVGNNIPMLHNSTSFASHPDTRVTNYRDRDGNGGDWNDALQRLSLGH